MNKLSVDEHLSSMLDIISTLKSKNVHDDGSYETIDFDTERLLNQLSNRWVYIRCEVDRLKKSCGSSDE